MREPAESEVVGLVVWLRVQMCRCGSPSSEDGIVRTRGMATQFRNHLEPGVQMLPRDQGHIRGSILLFIRKWLIKLV